MSLPRRNGLPAALVFAMLALGLAGVRHARRRQNRHRRQSCQHCRPLSRPRIWSDAGA